MFPFFRMAAGRAVAGYLVVVVGVERLAEFQHNVIGRVDHIIDGTDAVAAETVADPFRRRADLHVFQQAATETAAAALVLDMNRAAPFEGRSVFHHMDFRQGDLPAEDAPTS